MIYLTGEHALNIGCELETCGDWHRYSLAWENLTLRESEGSLWGDYGIEPEKDLPNGHRYPVANHIRALLDLLFEQNFSIAQGMNEDFICNDKYNEEIFRQVGKMKVLPYFYKIDRFMTREYFFEWENYKKENNVIDKEREHIFNSREKRKFKKLDVDFAVPGWIETSFDKFIDYINNDSRLLEIDYYEDDLKADIEMLEADGLSEEQITILLNYYCRKGIFADHDKI